jgi:hypothetical protein
VTLQARFPRQPRRGMLLGFSRARVITGVDAVLILVLGFMMGGRGPLVVAVAMDVVLVVCAVMRVQGRYLIEWLPLWSHWKFRGLVDQQTYRARVMTVRPTGSLALPGDATNLRFIDVGDATYIHDPSAGTLTAALRVEHSAMVLLDADAQAERVGGWSRVLSSLAGSDSVTHVVIIEETIPDTGNGPVDWFLDNWTKVDDWPSKEYFSLLETNQTQSSTHRTTFTVTVKTGRGGLSDSCINLAAQREGLEFAMRSAGLRIVGWLNEAQLASQIRGAYAPFSSSSATQLGLAGPVAIDESWNRIRHDDGYSCVLALAEFPAVPVGPQFLHSLVFSAGARHTLTLIARVQGVDEALRQVRREKIAVTADHRQKQKIGQMEEMSDRTEYAGIEERELALLQGHASVRLTGLLTVTAPSEELLGTAVAQMKRDAGQCACEARVLYGMQAAAFVAAALPVGRAI